MPRRKGNVPSAGDKSRRKPLSKTKGSSKNGHFDRGGGRGPSSTFLCPEDRAGFAVLSAVTVLAYAPVFRAGFVWDDSIVTDSKLVQSWGGVYDLWFRPSKLRNEIHYWPMVYTTFWLEYRLWGLHPLGYHVINLVLHVANSYLVRRLLRKLGASDGASWLAASLFALHPTRVESVAWVIERKDVLSGLFYLMALLRHPSVGSGEVERPGELRDLLTSLGFYALGMLSKSIVVSLPVTLLVIPWMMRGTLSPLEINRVVPFFVVGVLMALFDMNMARAGEPVDFGFSLPQRILISARALCFYLTQLVWPSKLMVVYPRWSFDEDRTIWAWCFLSIAAASLASLFILVISRPGKSANAISGSHTRLILRVPSAAFVCFGATLFPVLCVLDYGYMNYSYVADRFGYLAAIAPISLFSVASLEGCIRIFTSSPSPSIMGVTTTPPVVLIAASCLLAMLASLTYQHASIYTSEEAFFGHIVGLNPSARSMWTNLGNTYMRQDRNAEAVQCYEKSYKQDPSSDKLYTNYGIVLSKLGRTEEAVKMLQRGLKIEDQSSGSRKRILNELGNAMSHLKKHGEAVGYFQQALAIDPNYAIGWNNLGNDLFRTGRSDEAVRAYRRAFEVNPNYTKARMNCALVLESLKRYNEQIELLQEVLKREPGNNEAKQRLDSALAKEPKSVGRKS